MRRRARSSSSVCSAQDDVPMSPRMIGATSTMVELASENEPIWSQVNESMHNFIDTTEATSSEALSESDVDVIRRAFLAGARNGIDMGDDVATDFDQQCSIQHEQDGGADDADNQTGKPANLGILLQAAETVASFRRPVYRQPEKRRQAHTQQLESAVFKRLRAVLAR